MRRQQEASSRQLAADRGRRLEVGSQRSEIDFNDFSIGSYGGTQDKSGSVTIESGGAALNLVGNRWQQIPFAYKITPNTVLEFDFQSSAQGEIHGIGFDTDLSLVSNRAFQLYGTQNWGWAFQDFHNYPGDGSVQHYRIEVGNFYTGDMQYLFFVMDHDVGSPTGNSIFSNIQVYEDAGATPPTITSIPSTMVTVGEAYAYDANNTLEATGSLPIIYSLGSGPTGMSVSSDGLVSWTPSDGQEGVHLVEIVATNNFGTDTQIFNISVSKKKSIKKNFYIFGRHSF